METTTLRNLHLQYARPAEPTGFWQTCRVAADRAELDSLFVQVWADKKAQHGVNFSTVLG